LNEATVAAVESNMEFQWPVYKRWLQRRVGFSFLYRMFGLPAARFFLRQALLLIF
jgi:hypothetical protein